MSKRKKKVVAAKPEQFIVDDFALTEKQILLSRKMLLIARNFMLKHRVLFECISKLRQGKLFVMRNSWGGQDGIMVVLGCRVSAIAEIAPVLELLEKELKITFDASEDRPDMMWRCYTSKQLRWLRVDAEVIDGSAACKKVIVCYEQTPKYEMQCD